MAIRFGLLGAGRIGKVHAKAVTGDAQAKLVAVADAMPAAAQAIADQYGCDVRTIEAIEAAKDIDAVVICTPTDTHADLIERFVKAGKAVFCEKPIATDLAETVEAINACNEAGVKLMIGLQRRFDPNFKRVKTAIQNKEVGDTIIVSSLLCVICFS
jgi:myo-inositol 2-dehydrogenase/D-chiro-inositol 1-dehydrogenase